MLKFFDLSGLSGGRQARVLGRSAQQEEQVAHMLTALTQLALEAQERPPMKAEPERL